MIKYQRVDNIFQKQIGKSFCLLKNKGSSVYKINHTAFFLWELLEKKQTKKSLSIALSDKYKISLSKAQQDVEDFLEYYIAEKLIKKTSN